MNITRRCRSFPKPTAGWSPRPNGPRPMRGGAYVEIRVGRMRIGGGPLGLGDQFAVGFGKFRERRIVFIVETKLLFHKLLLFYRGELQRYE